MDPTECSEQAQCKKVQNEIAHYKEKYEVQQKRIQFLKRQNQQLKEKMHENGEISDKIKVQNDTLKKRNKQLKSQLNELTFVMKASNTHNGPKTVTLKNVIINPQTEEIDLPHQQISDQDLQTIKQFHSIKSLLLGQNLITNFGMYTICNSFQNLRKLFINHNQINDDGVSSIGKLKKLKCLDIRCNKITSQALKHICKLTQLNQLSISNNNINDQNLELLKDLTQLKYLDITSNQISQKGGLLIAYCPGLNNLYLSHNKITTTCVVKFLELEQLKVLDVRFNEVANEDKENLKEKKREGLQLFL